MQAGAHCICAASSAASGSAGALSGVALSTDASGIAASGPPPPRTAASVSPASSDLGPGNKPVPDGSRPQPATDAAAIQASSRRRITGRILRLNGAWTSTGIDRPGGRSEAT
jgi:hypothetical protein